MTPETIVEIKSGQFPVQTGNGVVHVECMGELLLPLIGAKGERETLHLKHDVYMKELYQNLVSGEKFYKRGGRQEGNRLVNCDGTILTYIGGGRFLISLHVMVYESIAPDFGWAPDPREIVRSLPKHVKDRLKARKTDYARNEDYNVLRESTHKMMLPRGRGRPKRVVQQPYIDQKEPHIEEVLTLKASVIEDEKS